MELKFEPERLIGDLIEDAENPRTHSTAEVDELAASMKRFGGMPSPVLIGEDRVVIAGHRRLAAARKLGWSAVPVMVVSGLSPAQRKALALADNKIASRGGWDEALVRLALEELREDNEEIEGLGFGQKEIERIFSNERGAKVREVAVTPVADKFWISVRGPLAGQAAMLAALRGAATALPGVEVELGTLRGSDL